MRKFNEEWINERIFIYSNPPLKLHKIITGAIYEYDRGEALRPF
jgi:hypothetical protein